MSSSIDLEALMAFREKINRPRSPSRQVKLWLSTIPLELQQFFYQISGLPKDR